MGKMKEIEIKIPNLGEATETQIIEVNISVGDKVKVDDPLIVLESEKAAMEVPSEFEGEITNIFIKEGDNVSEGMLFAKIKSNAKINLALNVVGKSKKLHKIESLVAFIEHHDLILIKKIRSKNNRILFNGKLKSKSGVETVTIKGSATDINLDAIDFNIPSEALDPAGT